MDSAISCIGIDDWHTMYSQHRSLKRLTGIAAVVTTLAILFACLPSPALAADDATPPNEQMAVVTEQAPIDATEAENVNPTPQEESLPAGETYAPETATSETQPESDVPETVAEPAEEAPAAEIQEQEELEAQESAATGIDGSFLIETGASESHVLTAASATAGAKVAPSAYSSKNANQVWDISYDSAADAHRILLASSDGRLALATDGSSRLFLATVGTTDPKISLLWALFAAGGDGYQIASITYPDLCVSSTTSASSIAAKSPAASAPTTQCHYLINTNPIVRADAHDVEETYHITVAASSQVVEARGGNDADGTEIQVYNLNGKNHQKIYLERDAQGFYTAWIVGTGKVIDVRGGSLMPGTSIIQWTSKAADNQKWALNANGDGTYSLINKATGLALGIRNGKIVGVRATSNERASFELSVANLLSAGIYAITPRTNTNVCIDVSKASTKNGAKMILYKQSGALNQRFQLVSAGDSNLWRIRTGSSGGWITYANGGISQQGNSGTAASNANTWKITFKGGWYCLINQASGKALDMKGGSTRNGTNIIAWTPNGKDSQHFNFVSSDLIKEGVYHVTSYYGVRLDVTGASTKVGANVQTWTGNKGANQRFRFQKSGSGYLMINDKSGLVVTAGDLYREGANITQRLVSGLANQLWVPLIADGGYLCFSNVGTGKVLALDKTGTDSYNNGLSISSKGRNAIQLTKAGSDNTQRWKLKATSGINKTAAKNASKRILLVGNSFTFYNDLASKLAAQVSGAEVVSCTRSSATLQQHASTTDSLGKKTRAAIQQGGWDYVVFQEMSTQCIDDYDSYLSNLRTLSNLAKNAGAAPIMYGTWAFSGGTGSQGRGSSARGITNAAMNSQLQAAFSKVSKATGIKYVDTGKEFATKTSGHAAFDKKLYTSDKKHPSSYATGLIASIIAKALV